MPVTDGNIERYQAPPAGPPGPGLVCLWTTSRVTAALETFPHSEYGIATLTAPDSTTAIDGTSVTIQHVLPGGGTAGHRHSWWHLYLVRTGSTTVETIDGAGEVESRPLHEGDILSIAPFVAHRFLSEEGAAVCCLINVSNRPEEQRRGTAVATEVRFDAGHRPSSLLSGGTRVQAH